MVYQHAIALYLRGHVPESHVVFERLRLLERERTPEIDAYVEVDEVHLSWASGDAERALVHAHACAERANTLGNIGVLGVVVLRAFSWAFLAGGRYEDALKNAQDYGDAAARAGRDHVAEAAVVLAAARLGIGEHCAAHAAAIEAIDLARRTPRAFCEILAHGVKARALLRRDGATAREEAAAAFLDAAAVIERTGARIFTPMLCEWRAELAAVLGDDAGRVQLLSEAREHFERMGVPLQVARLAALLPT